MRSALRLGITLVPLLLGLACSNPKGEATGCTINGEAIDGGALNPLNQCQVCNPQTNPGGWSNAPSGSSCGPGGSICAGGTCQAGCYVSSVFFPTGAANPANGCLSCQPAVSTTGWSPFSGAPPAGTCPMGGICTQGHCQQGCAIGTTAVPAGATNPDNFCQSCQPNQEASFWTNKAPGAACADGGAVCVNGTCTAGCEIGGVLYNPGNPNPANLCQTCQPNFSVSMFTPATGLAPGGDCGSGAYCYQGQCSNGCSILGTSYAPGDPDPGSACLGCVPGVSATSWSNLDPGTPCSDGGVCSGGVCLFNCDIGATLYDPGAVNPADVCSGCQPATNPNDWTPLTTVPPNGCNGGQVCLDGGCVAGCYIAEPFKPGAFHQPGEWKVGNDALCCSSSINPASWSPTFGPPAALTPYGGTPIPYSSYGPALLVAADFNRDGRPDVALLSTSSIVAVYLGASDGGFVGATFGYLLSGATTSLATGDLNGDGFLDLVASDSTGFIQVLMNRGDGTFGTATGYPTNLTFLDAGPDDGGLPVYYNSNYRSNLALADVNRDGVPDALIAGGSFEGLSLMLGIGDGGFQPGAPLDTGTLSTYAVVAADVNRDGALDLIALGDSALSVYSNPPSYVQVSTSSQVINLLLGDGKGSFGTPTNVLDAGLYFAFGGIATGDFNGDGNQDLAAIASYSASLEILIGAGDGTFAGPVAYAGSSYSGTQLAVADFDGDGHPDVAVNTCPLLVFLNLGHGTFSNGRAASTTLCPSSLAAADFDGDGLSDLAVEDYTSIASIWSNNCR